MKRPLRSSIVLVASLLAAGAPAAAQEPDSLLGVLDDCDGLHLAEQGRHVKDAVIRLGHLEVSFAEGTLVPVLGKHGTALGAYFEGHGGYVYTAADTADRAAMEVNVPRVAKTLRLVGGKLMDDFKKVLILSTDAALADLPGESAGATNPSTMTASFTQYTAGALNTYGEFDFRDALVRLNGKGRWVYIEIDGGLEHVGYAYDDALSGRERFLNFRKLADYATRFSQTLSIQRVPGWPPSRLTSVSLVKADITVATQDNKSGTLSWEMTYRVREPGTRLLALNLFNNRDYDSFLWSSDHRKLTLEKVLDADGKDLPFSHKYDELVVEIPPTAAADAEVRLKFSGGGDVFVDMKGQHTDSYFSLGYTDWYPAPGWAGQRFTFHLKATCKRPWRPILSGRQTAVREDGDLITAESVSDRPSSLITLFGGKYVTNEATVDGMTIRVHAYAMARRNVLDNMPKLAGALVKFYTSILGPMPADELNIVEVPEYGFGISPAGVILITTEAYKPHQDELANYLARGINARLAHEIAHQWFGHKLVPADSSDNWLSESFAEYFSGLAMGAMAGNDTTLFGFTRMLADWRAEDKYCTAGAPITTASYLGGEDGEKDRRCLIYYRGPLVLHMLRTSIGNDRFNASAKRLLEIANNGPASTDDFSKALTEVVQQDMSWYVDQWVRRSGNAQVAVEQHVEENGAGQYKLWGTIKQAPGDSFKRLLVPLVWDNGGKPEARVVFADQPEKRFEFILPAKPSAVKPDPFQNNLAVYK